MAEEGGRSVLPAAGEGGISEWRNFGAGRCSTFLVAPKHNQQEQQMRTNKHKTTKVTVQNIVTEVKIKFVSKNHAVEKTEGPKEAIRNFDPNFEF